MTPLEPLLPRSLPPSTVLKAHTLFYVLFLLSVAQWALIAAYPMQDAVPYGIIAVQTVFIASCAIFFGTMRILIWFRPNHATHYQSYYDTSNLSDVICLLILITGGLAMSFKRSIEWPVYSILIVIAVVDFLGMYLVLLPSSRLKACLKRHFVVESVDSAQEIGHVFALALCIIWSTIHGFYADSTVLWLNVCCLLLWLLPLVLFAVSTVFDSYHWRVVGMSCRHAPAFWFLWTVYVMVLGSLLFSAWLMAGWTESPDGIPWAMLFAFGVPSMLLFALLGCLLVVSLVLGIFKLCVYCGQGTQKVCCPV